MGPRKAGERAVSRNFYFEQPPNGEIGPKLPRGWETLRVADPAVEP